MSRLAPIAFALFLTASLSAQADSRWRLVGTDMVQGPLSDLQLMHAKRKVADALLSERRSSVALLATQYANEQRISDAWKKAEAASRQREAQAYADLGDCKDANTKLQRKLRRSRTIATVCGVIVGVEVVIAGAYIYNQLAP